MWRLLVPLLAAPLLAATPPAHQVRTMRPDFSAVDSIAKANALAARGKLVAILLFPEELGGPAAPENIAYVTPEAVQARTLILGTLRRMASEGTLDQLKVEPDYKGASVVPSRVRFKAWHTGKKGSFEAVVEVW